MPRVFSFFLFNWVLKIGVKHQPKSCSSCSKSLCFSAVSVFWTLGWDGIKLDKTLTRYENMIHKDKITQIRWQYSFDTWYYMRHKSQLDCFLLKVGVLVLEQRERQPNSVITIVKNPKLHTTKALTVIISLSWLLLTKSSLKALLIIIATLQVFNGSWVCLSVWPWIIGVREVKTQSKPKMMMSLSVCFL